MDEASGCFGAALVVFAVLWMMDKAFTAVGTAVYKNGDTIIAFILIVTVGGLIPCAVAYFISDIEYKAKRTEARQIKVEKAEEVARVNRLVRRVRVEFAEIEAEDTANRVEHFKTIASKYDAKIALSMNSEDDVKLPTFHWGGCGDDINAIVKLYRGAGTLYQTIPDIEKSLGEKALMAKRSIKRANKYVVYGGSVGEWCFFMFWTSEYQGFKPALNVDGVLKSNFDKSDLTNSATVEKVPYTIFLKGGLRSERLYVPPYLNPLDLEDQKIRNFRRKMDLAEQREELGMDEEGSNSSGLARMSEKVLKQVKKMQTHEQDLESAIEMINGDPDLSEENKEDAVALLKEQAGLM